MNRLGVGAETEPATRGASPVWRRGATRLSLATLLYVLLAEPSALARNILVLSPMASTAATETHAALALAPGVYMTDLHFSGQVATLRQLRKGSAPNPWECAWIVWNYGDPAHFYYLALKPEGWELGKRDPAYAGGQRFLATGARRFHIGSWATFDIFQAGGKIIIEVDRLPLVSVVDDREPVYSSGRIGLYTEDATAAIRDLRSPIVEDFADYEVKVETLDGAFLGRWSLPFLGFGAGWIAAFDDRE
jgi:hypothetical protein